MGKSWTRCAARITALSILLSLTFFPACRTRVELRPVRIPDARIVGSIEAGAIVWEPGEDQAGRYIIVTEGYPVELVRLAYKILELELEIKELKAGKK